MTREERADLVESALTSLITTVDIKTADGLVRKYIEEDFDEDNPQAVLLDTVESGKDWFLDDDEPSGLATTFEAMLREINEYNG